MKKLSYFFIVLFLIVLSSCSKENDAALPKQDQGLTSDARKGKLKLTYEVLCNDLWSGEMNDKFGKRVQVMNKEGGWKYTFHPTKTPFEMGLFAEANCAPCNGSRDPSEDVIINFYVNDQRVTSDTNTWAKGVTSIYYTVP